MCLILRQIVLRPVTVVEEARFQSLLQDHHYLGSLPKIGYTPWYVVALREQSACSAELLRPGLTVCGP